MALPNSSASLSVLSFGLASAAFSFRNCHICPLVLAVVMSVCCCLPKQIRTSCNLVVEIVRHLLGALGRLALAPPGEHQWHR